MESLVHSGKSSERLEMGVSSIDKDSKETKELLQVLPCLPAEALDDYPDGGFRAWLVLFGAFCISFSSWGYINSWGVFQAYYQQTILLGSSSSEMYVPTPVYHHLIALHSILTDRNQRWIGSLQHSIIFLPGLIVGRLFDIGLFRIPCAIGSLLIVLATFLVPLCRTLMHFLLCQGLTIGLGCGLVFPPTTAVVCHWWKRRRGFALGVMTCGAALSGTIIPIVVRQLLEVVGFAWTLRIIGFILILTLGLANMCVARRLPPIKPAGHIFNWSVFRNSAFSLYCAAQFVLSFGVFIVLIYISSSAISAGISRNFAFYLVAIINASAGAGRLLFGLLGDRSGAMNVIVATSVFVAALTMIWPHCRSVASITLHLLWNFFPGYRFLAAAYTALSYVPPAAMGGPEDIGLRIGTVNTFIGIGTLCGPPLAGLLNDTRLGYAAVGYFGGGMLLLGTVFVAVARFLAVPRLWSKY
ncbi:major facilitator superfamily domain-containing protein [Mycena leptocephala]|nr:major facilitator superfamily domain-containing protein [Mycena leptocephala]